VSAPAAGPPGPGTRVAAIGGGHGLAITLTALRRLGIEPTAIVTVADDGGSSGRLRRDLGMLPPGDLRMSLLALAGPRTEVAGLFGYRFRIGDTAGHNLGNLIIAALADLEGGFLEAVRVAARLLDVRGRVLPSTLDPVRLEGRINGHVVSGQAALGHSGGPIESVWLDPGDPPALPEAVAAVEQADHVLLGPGSTFTSLVPNLLVPGLGRAVAAASDRVTYVCNLEPQMGETAGFAPADHLEALLDHCPGLRVSRVICQRPDSAGGVLSDVAALADLGAVVHQADITVPGEPGRHDPDRLAGAFAALLAGARV
jgi:uncharacterized cofD-like protein